jgi:hypothetical protein
VLTRDPNAAFNLYCPDHVKWHMYALKRISVGDSGQQLLSVHHAGQRADFRQLVDVLITSHVFLSEHRVVCGAAL